MCSIIGYLGKEFTAESIRPYFDRTVSRGPDQTRMLPRGAFWASTGCPSWA